MASLATAISESDMGCLESWIKDLMWARVMNSCNNSIMRSWEILKGLEICDIWLTEHGDWDNENKMGHLARINTQTWNGRPDFGCWWQVSSISFFQILSLPASTILVCSSHPFYFFFLLNKGEEKEHCYNLVPYPHPGVKNLKKLIYSSLQIKTGNFLMYIQALTNIQICICKLPGLQFIYCALQTNQVP